MESTRRAKAIVMVNVKKTPAADTEDMRSQR